MVGTRELLATLTEKVHHRLICWVKWQGFLDSQAAADMRAWEKSGFSVVASVRITLTRFQLRVYCQP